MRFDWSMFAERCAGPRALAASTLLACVLVAVPGLAVGAGSQSWNAASTLAASPAPRGLRLVWGDTEADLARTLDQLERAGFHVAVAVPPHAYYVQGESKSGAPLPPGLTFATTREPKWEAGQAVNATPSALEAQSAPTVDLFGGVGDLFPPAKRGGAEPFRAACAATLSSLAGLPFGARWHDTSEYMIGRVAVSLLFPESDGSTDPNRYDWTPALRDSVVRSAVRGLAHWSVFAARHGIAVSFVIEVHPGLATRYEPIDQNAVDEENWIRDALVSLLGYQGDAITLCYDVANAARARLGAQWAAVVFAVQNDTDPDGLFADGIISHALLGGPYFVTPVKNGTSALQGASLDTYMEHEMAHTFWVLDEHLPASGWWACSLRTGYLNQPNCNSLVPAAGYCNTTGSPCNSPPLQCLMKGNYPDSVCKYTEWQIGWADRNLSGIPDLLETRAAVFPDSGEYRATAGPPVTLNGYAREIPLRNENPYYFGFGDSISIATVDSVRFRVDGGPPQLATPTDGIFDSGRESFIASLGALPPGNYLVDWEVWNSNGLPNLTAPTTAVSLLAPSSPAGAEGDATPPPGTSLHLGPSPGDGAVRFRLRGEPNAEGRASVFDVAGRTVARWTVRIPASGALDWRWDGKDGGGAQLPSGLYFATVELAGQTVIRRLVVAR